jgi:polar amino acid transport system substrate-binding protein
VFAEAEGFGQDLVQRDPVRPRQRAVQVGGLEPPFDGLLPSVGDPVVAVLGLGLNYAAYESEIYRAALESIPALQLEAARTLGLSEWQILRLVRGPQALRLALAPMTNDFVALLKDSSLVSVITVVELTKQTAIYATNAGSWAVPGTLCALVYLGMSLPLARIARHLEQRWKQT